MQFVAVLVGAVGGRLCNKHSSGSRTSQPQQNLPEGLDNHDYTRETSPVWGASDRLIGHHATKPTRAEQAQKRLSSTTKAHLESHPTSDRNQSDTTQQLPIETRVNTPAAGVCNAAAQRPQSIPCYPNLRCCCCGCREADISVYIHCPKLPCAHSYLQHFTRTHQLQP
jgi:hypothetical protein